MLVGLSGPAKYYEPGELYECDEAEAARLIGARYAVPWVEDRIERAVDEPMAVERRDPLDHDSNGKKGGSLPRKPRAKKVTD